jgi:U4/U6 small nuclear ribonucleoprotein PRP4
MFFAIVLDHFSILLMQSMRRELDEHEAKVKEFELKRKMRTTVIPTDDLKVRQMLRQLGEPITIFGEKEVLISHLITSGLPLF